MILLYNALIVSDDSRFEGYVAVEGDSIARVGRGVAPAELIDAADEAYDLGGDMLLPGVIDTHVHFRDPGLTEKADMSTESKAAVMGGVTSFVDMPNTIPATTTMAEVEAKMRRASEVSVANYGFFIGATNDNIDEILAADYSRVAGVKLFVGSSTGNMLVDDTSVIGRLFREVKAPVAVHAEDEATIARCREEVKAEYPDGEVPVERHPDIRSRRACMTATEKVVDLARRYGTRLHICHISTADELSLLEPGSVSVKKITSETCPHYLFFDSNDYDRLGARIKCNPAIKDCSDRLALLKAVACGLIDTVATDHAPHLMESKHGGALKAASGMPGIEYSLPLMLELTEDNSDLTPERVVRLMCHNPAEIFGIEQRGYIREGYYADLTVVKKTPFKVSDAGVTSRCGWTPYDGVTLGYRPVMTLVNGRIVMVSGHLTGDRHAMPLRFAANG